MKVYYPKVFLGALTSILAVAVFASLAKQDSHSSQSPNLQDRAMEELYARYEVDDPTQSEMIAALERLGSAEVVGKEGYEATRKQLSSFANAYESVLKDGDLLEAHRVHLEDIGLSVTEWRAMFENGEVDEFSLRDMKRLADRSFEQYVQETLDAGAPLLKAIILKQKICQSHLDEVSQLISKRQQSDNMFLNQEAACSIFAHDLAKTKLESLGIPTDHFDPFGAVGTVATLNYDSS